MTKLRAIADYYYGDEPKELVVAQKGVVYRGQICLDKDSNIRFICLCDDGHWRDLGIYCFVPTDALD